MKAKIALIFALGVMTGLISGCSRESTPSSVPDSSGGTEPSSLSSSQPSETDAQDTAEIEMPELPGREGDQPLVRLLGTKEELFAFAEWVGTGASYYCQDLTWQLDADIDLEGEPWSPIGPLKNVLDLRDAKTQLEGYDYLIQKITQEKEENPEFYEDMRSYLGFFGTFDGNGHRITGLNVPYENVQCQEDPYTQSGFFAVLGAGSLVRDLHIEGTVQGFGDTGGLAGRGPYGLHTETPAFVIGCSFTGTVELPTGIYRSHGGFGGLIGSTGEDLQIRNSFALADVSGDNNVGGLIGSANNNSEILNCFCRGTVTAVPAFQKEGKLLVSNIGGLTGASYNGTFINCYSDTNLVITAMSGPIGGFIGYHSGQDSGCVYNAQKTGDWGPGYAYPGSNTKFNAIALSPEEMKDPQIFRDLGWDLDVVWQLEEGDISPSLRS
ncbi:hypothetical protein H9X81_03810 [Hydrogenoanaerobacterium saccharovorans]|uniref:GLUG domain-containing protein n=1 Tax=Hydrogenoanaerobacterium saccharovorans TaxID=474960 RepID=A0ABS2GM68_9FIRM|nr:hypothetical protein [Hydrogenoanaerobacterium saccharovorans]MBM6922819.1 hypothetical protein [Hydrogenoanaerobacterium saccharovorans]